MLKDSNPLLSINPPDTSNTTKDYIKKYFINSYSIFEELFRTIKPNSVMKSPDQLRRPLIFYLGHTAVVYIQKLILSNLTKSINGSYETLFAAEVDPICKEELDNEIYHQQMPDLKDVLDYRKLVSERIIEVIDKLELKLPIDDQSPWWSILMGCEYERIHYEATTLLIRQLDVDCLVKPENWKYAPSNQSSVLQNEYLKVNGGKVTIGKDRKFSTFGWDNEYGSLKAEVNEFEATKYLITNLEFLQFVNDNSYEKDDLWTDEGLEWKKISNAKFPKFWKKIEDENKKITFKYRAIFDVIDIPLDWPVECNFHEAKAYLNWLNKKDKQYTHRFIKEKEWISIRAEKEIQKLSNIKDESSESDIGGFYNNSNTKKIGNVNMLFGSSTPVNYFDPSPAGFYDCYGNVWEYTEDYFRALPGFKPHFLYYDFSGPSFDYYHTLVLGGAWSSTGLSASSYCRHGYRRHFYQNIGFRVVREKIKPQILDLSNIYEQRKCIGEYISSFYYANHDQFFNVNLNSKIDNSCSFATVLGGFDYIFENDYGMKLALEAIQFYKIINPDASKENNLSAFDNGCGVGKTAFYLSTFFNKVVGLDYSTKFIEICETLKEKGFYEYEILSNGDNYTKAKATIPDYIDRSKLEFIVGDSMNLPHLFGPFDLILASNLIDRLTNPAEGLINLRNKLKKGGIVILTSPYTWLENFTSKEEWIGGKNGESTFEALKILMKSFCFEFVGDKSLVLLIREHEKKYQLIYPHMTVWKKVTFKEDFNSSIFKN